MANVTSPEWRGFFIRAPLPPDSLPTTPIAPKAAGITWHAAQPTQPLPAAPAASRPTPPPRLAAPSAAFPDWWPTVWPSPLSTPLPAPAGTIRSAASGNAPSQPYPSRLDAGAAHAPSRRDAGVPGAPPGPAQAGPSSRAGFSSPPPPTRPAQAQPQPVPPRRPRPLSPRLRCCLEWLVSSLPEPQRAEVRWAFEQTLRFRAALEERSSLEGQQPIGRERFGLAGETLVPEGTVRVRVWLDDEVRETLRTCEMRLSRTRRNAYLAMHSARLGQLWAELERRFSHDVVDLNVLEEVKRALARRWA